MSKAIERFVQAQDAGSGGFASALDELRAGRKRSHWIWYVFPQLRGLGSSSLAVQFGLEGIDEARRYVQHPLLRVRLIEATEAAVGQIRSGVALTTLMGTEIDAMKLVSSMTLFSHVARECAGASEIGVACLRLATAADVLLDAAAREGFPPCGFTLAALSHGKHPSAV